MKQERPLYTSQGAPRYSRHCTSDKIGYGKVTTKPRVAHLVRIEFATVRGTTHEAEYEQHSSDADKPPPANRPFESK